MFIFINAMKITAFIYMIGTELMSHKLYFHTDNPEDLHLHLEKVLLLPH